MRTKIIEVTNGFNWGKFLIGEFDTEWGLKSEIPLDPSIEALNMPLLNQLGWARGQYFLVLDLQTGEGAIFNPVGSARHDLNGKHKIWVCPMFEPFLLWLYEQPMDLDKLPTVVNFTEQEAPSAMYGYRRGGPDIPQAVLPNEGGQESEQASE